MATERQLGKADAEEQMARVCKLICVGGLTSLLTVGCANMKTEGGDAAAVAQPAPAAVQERVQEKAQERVHQSVPSPAQVPVQAPAQAAAAADAAADEAAERAAEQLVASLAKPASEVSVPVTQPKPTPAPVVAEPKPVPKPVVKVEVPKPVPAPVVKVEPVPAPAPVPVAPVVPVVKAAPAPLPAPVAAPEPEPVQEEAAAILPAVELEKSAGDSDLSASASRELPIRFELWRIDKGKGPYDASVVLISPTFQLGNDRAAAQLYVTVMADKILVTSTSDIAAKKGLSGVRIDEGGWLPFTDVTSDNVGVVRGNWLDKLENGAKLSVRMGLFPEMSKNPEQFDTEISLGDMRKAVPRYRNILK